MTEYILLTPIEATDDCRILGRVTAHTPEAAARAHMADAHAHELDPAKRPAKLVVIAVPARHWQPLTVKVEQTTRVTVTKADA